MASSYFYPQLTASGNNIGRQMQQKKANTFYSCCPQPFWQGQMPNTVEQITGNQSCLKQDVICPKLIGSNAGSSKIILRACSESPEQKGQESKIDKLQAGIKFSFTVFP